MWAHVHPLISLSVSVTSSLESGSSWTLAEVFLLEKSESQQVLVCLLPALCEIKKKKKKVVDYKEKKRLCKRKEKKSFRKMEK